MMALGEEETYSSIISSGRLAKAHAACFAFLVSAVSFGVVTAEESILIIAAILTRPQCS
jgi:hypothetical protein